jgi:hypothetical protein
MSPQVQAGGFLPPFANRCTRSIAGVPFPDQLNGRIRLSFTEPVERFATNAEAEHGSSKTSCDIESSPHLI